MKQVVEKIRLEADKAYSFGNFIIDCNYDFGGYIKIQTMDGTLILMPKSDDTIIISNKISGKTK